MLSAARDVRRERIMVTPAPQSHAETTGSMDFTEARKRPYGHSRAAQGDLSVAAPPSLTGQDHHGTLIKVAPGKVRITEREGQPVELVKVGETADTVFYRLEGQWNTPLGKQHFHIRAHGVHGCVTGIEGADEAEASGNALDAFIPEFQVATDREDWSLDDVFGNQRLTYCAMRDCDGCDLEVHVVRMQDQRRAVAPRVLIFDLS